VRIFFAPARFFFLVALFAGISPAFAEKADKDKPTQIEANSLSADETRRLNIFEGNVLLTKGTLTVRADRIVVRQDPEGNQYATATGAPVRFRQRQDPKDGKPGGWIDGEALRIEIDDRKSTVELFDKARVTRDGDEVLGSYIFVDQRSDFYSVSAGKGAPGGGGGRVRATIQPKIEPEGKK
jgi:lipopolysaccharide export system protein LptA